MDEDAPGLRVVGLLKKWGAASVVSACASALDHEVVSIGLIGHMLERGSERTAIQLALPGTVIAGRFARDAEHFAVKHPDHAGGTR